MCRIKFLAAIAIFVSGASLPLAANAADPVAGAASPTAVMSSSAPATSTPTTTSTATTKVKTSGEAHPPFHVARGFSRVAQKYTGITWLTNETLSGIASTMLSLKTHGLVHARIRAYSFTDLLDGEFRSVDISARSGEFHGVPFGSVHVASQTPFKLRYFQRKGHDSGLRTPLLLSLSGDIDERAVSKALKAPAVANGLRFLKLDLPGLGEQHLQVLQPHVDLDKGRIILDSYLITAGASRDTGIPLHVVATPQLEKERYIVLRNMKVQSSEIQDPEDFADFTDKLLNPLIDFGRMDRFTHAFRLSNLDVTDGRVNYSGRLLLAPKQTAKPTFSAPFSLANPDITGLPK